MNRGYFYTQAEVEGKGRGREGTNQAFCFLSKLLRSHIQHCPRVCSSTAVILSLMLVQRRVVVHREGLVQTGGGFIGKPWSKLVVVYREGLVRARRGVAGEGRTGSGLSEWEGRAG